MYFCLLSFRLLSNLSIAAIDFADNLRLNAQSLPEQSDGDIFSMNFFMRLVVVAVVTRPRLSGYRQRLAVCVNVVDDD